MIERVFTLHDLVPGSVQEQQEKVAVLARIQRRLKPAVMKALDPEMQAEIREILPKGPLAPITTVDLPSSLTRCFRSAMEPWEPCSTSKPKAICRYRTAAICCALTP